MVSFACFSAFSSGNIIIYAPSQISTITYRVLYYRIVEKSITLFAKVQKGEFCINHPMVLEKLECIDNCTSCLATRDRPQTQAKGHRVIQVIHKFMQRSFSHKWKHGEAVYINSLLLCGALVWYSETLHPKDRLRSTPAAIRSWTL